MVKPFHIQQVGTVPNARGALHIGRIRLAPIRSSENTNWPSQSHLTAVDESLEPPSEGTDRAFAADRGKPLSLRPRLPFNLSDDRCKPHSTDAGTGSTSHTKRCQFMKPGFRDVHYSEPFSKSETSSAASLPYARSRSTLVTVTRQYILLLWILLAEYRTTWFFHVFGGLLIPISFAFFIVALGAAGNSEKAIHLLGGNMALSTATGPASFLITRLGSARQSKEFHYWIALPVAKLLLVLAIISVALLFALPGLLGIYVFGSLLLGLPFEASSWILLPLIPLGVLPLAGVGALLGLFAKSGEVANVFSNLLIVFVSILSPVMLPLESLPVPLRILSQFMPTTYVADAFRAVLGGYQGTNLAFDILILALFSAGLLTITYFRLDWRNS